MTGAHNFPERKPRCVRLESRRYAKIDPSIIVHRLNVSPLSPSIRQRKRVFAQERDKAIAEEVQKLLVADFIREVYYLDWLANVVMVKRANEKWRMCVDF